MIGVKHEWARLEAGVLTKHMQLTVVVVMDDEAMRLVSLW